MRLNWVVVVRGPCNDAMHLRRHNNNVTCAAPLHSDHLSFVQLANKQTN